MARNAEDMLVDEFVSEDRRSLLDIASGGRYETSEDLPSLLDVAKSAYGSLREYGARQQEELNRPITVSYGGEDIDLGVSQADLFGYVTGTLGRGATFAKTDVFNVNPSQARSVLKALPGKAEDNLGRLLKDPGRLISEVSRNLKNKYRPEFILQVLRQHYRELIGRPSRETLQREAGAFVKRGSKGQEYMAYPKKPIPKSLKKKERGPGWRGQLEQVGE